MSHDRYAELERRIADIEALIQGDMKQGVDGSGGMLGVLKDISETLYGCHESGKRGIVDVVQRMERIMWVCIGIGGTINVGWMVFIHFHK